MWIRDALESDTNALAELAGRPRDVVLDAIHDRTVRVAVEKPEAEGRVETETPTQRGTVTEPETETEGEPGAETGKPGESADESSVVGFVAFDARSGTVHVTDFGGPDWAVERLFGEPRRFGATEGMDVEVVVPDDDEARVDTVEDVGFVAVEAGPRFDGRETTRFRLEVDDDDA